ncbi:MAG: hypothetical protein C9356_14840 [Oleiphilus sp.]|nr:MAG: hypothetical protein C9356_14840 [Oleiphilus sp.]
MVQVSIAAVALISFFTIFAEHQVSRALIGDTADAYPSGMLIAAGIFGLTTSSVVIGLIALCFAALGHYLSVYLCRKYGWHHREKSE